MEFLGFLNVPSCSIHSNRFLYFFYWSYKSCLLTCIQFTFRWLYFPRVHSLYGSSLKRPINIWAIVLFSCTSSPDLFYIHTLMIGCICVFTGVMAGLNGCLRLLPSTSACASVSICLLLLYLCNNAVQPVWYFRGFFVFFPMGNSRVEVAPAAKQYLLFIRCWSDCIETKLMSIHSWQNALITTLIGRDSRRCCLSLIPHICLMIVLSCLTDPCCPDKCTSSVRTRDMLSLWLWTFVASSLWMRRSMISAYVPV